MSWAPGEVWRLVRGGEPLGEIVIESGDFPWLSGRFRPRPAFAEFRPLIDRELALIESDQGDRMEDWERTYDRITSVLRLLSPRGPVPEYLLHIRGDEAWFRWSEEPFDDGHYDGH